MANLFEFTNGVQKTLNDFKADLRKTWDRITNDELSQKKHKATQPEVRERVGQVISEFSRDRNPSDFRKY